MLVIDSHTEGEPTRVVVKGGPDLGNGSLAERAEKLASEHKAFYESLVLEPYGQEAMVGALLVEPVNKDCVTGVIYFDAAAVIGMCGHGTIGVAATLAHLGRMDVGRHKIETPVGIVEVELSDKNTVTVTNVDSYRYRTNVAVEVPAMGEVSGHIAWGGNWFFLVDQSPTQVTPDNIRALTEAGIAVRKALHENQIEGKDGGIIDHIIFYGPALTEQGHSRNFVLCPDNAYDRSPCGTGSSARLACLAADNRLAPNTKIRQESIIGSSYQLSYRLTDMASKIVSNAEQNQSGETETPNKSVLITPIITGQAFVTRESIIMDNPNDPLRQGITLTTV